VRWRKRHTPPAAPPRPLTRRELADADADAGQTPDLPAVPTDIRVHRDEPSAPDVPGGSPDADAADGVHGDGAADEPDEVPPVDEPDAVPPVDAPGDVEEVDGEDATGTVAPPPADRGRDDRVPDDRVRDDRVPDDHTADDALFAAAAEQAVAAQSPRSTPPAAGHDHEVEQGDEMEQVDEVDEEEWAWLTPSERQPAPPPDAPAPPPSAPASPPSAPRPPSAAATERPSASAPPPAAPAPSPAARARRPDAAGAPGALPGDAVLDDAEVAAAGRAVVRRALDEDLDVGGDVTSMATVSPEAVGRGTVVARAAGVVAGIDLVALVYDHLDPRVSVDVLIADGERVRRGQPLAHVAGPLRSVLTGERTALNLLTHLSGVATLTAEYVAAVEGTGCVVRDTRKTTPGLRLLEKAAVRAGGGSNHRIGLSDALLVKDNHVAAAGGVGPATRAALAGAEGRHVQVEVDSMIELDEALDAGARDVLLDNFDVETTRRAVDRVRERASAAGRVLLETSGGVTLETARDYAQTGVDRIAIGALTHSAPQLDIALDIDGDDPGGDVRPTPGSAPAVDRDEARPPRDGT
jgi:nicotinate-nucleotide pyrophosphorylase (carboxylating)